MHRSNLVPELKRWNDGGKDFSKLFFSNMWRRTDVSRIQHVSRWTDMAALVSVLQHTKTAIQKVMKHQTELN